MILFKTTFFTFCFFLLCLSFLVSCKDSVLDPTHQVSGIVLDEATGTPIEGAWVGLSEDNKGPFMGNHIIKETFTDAAGKFNFTFDWKEGPYEVGVTKPYYSYTRFEKGPNGLPNAYFTYQSLDFFKKDEQLEFPMQAMGTLDLIIRNISPAASSDAVTFYCENLRKVTPRSISYTINGTGEQTLNMGDVTAAQYVRIRYAVTEGTRTTQHKDSILIAPFKNNIFTLSY